MRKIPTAILGAGGWIGQHFARLLGDHPWFEPPLLVGGERTQGRTLEEIWQIPEEGPPGPIARERLTTASPAALERAGIRVAFSALPGDKASLLEPELARRGIAVFSNASAHRMDPRVPLLIPEVNPRHLGLLHPRPGRGFIVTNTNCSAAGLLLALKPLRDRFPVERVYVTTYQALSGAGFPGVPSLAIEDNVVPYIPEEETKMEEETRKVLGSLRGNGIRPLALRVIANCARVATREGHLEAVTVPGKFTGEGDILRAWKDFHPLREGKEPALPTAPLDPVLVHPAPDRPQPLPDRWAGVPHRARGMAVTVGRLRVDPDGIRFYLLVHNAVRGGAGGSVLNAELAVREGLLGEVV